MRLILPGLAAVVLLAGCAHRDYEYRGGTMDYSGDPAAANTKGAGARVMMGGSAYNDTILPGGTAASRYDRYRYSPQPDYSTTYQRRSSDTAIATTQGSAARAMVDEEPVQDSAISDGVGGSTTVGDSSAATTQGSGARTMIGGSATADLAPEDVTFLKNAAQQGIAEVKMGQLARERARNSELKKFGEHLVTDHAKANEELALLAQRKGIQVPMTMSLRDQEMIEKLSSASGTEFDRIAQRDAVEAHTRAIRDFQLAAERSRDPDIKAFAQRTLPVLEHHLEMARDLEIGTSGTERGGSNRP